MRHVGFGLLVLMLTLSGCGVGKKKEEITPELQAYVKPEEATVRLEGQAYPYCVWYDPEEWLIFDTPFDPCDEISEWTLILVDLHNQVSLGKDVKKRAFAKTYTYKDKNVSRSEYKDFVQKKIIGQDQENLVLFKDLGSDERIVNNLKVFAWKFQVDYQNAGSFTTFLYFYSDNEGSVAIATITPSEKWKENEKDMEAFLNGFCLMESS